MAAQCRYKLAFSAGRDLEFGEERLKPRALDDGPEVGRVLAGQITGVGNGHDPLSRIVAHRPGGGGDGDGERFHGAWRHIDNQALALAPPYPHELMRDGVDVPVVEI